MESNEILDLFDAVPWPHQMRGVEKAIESVSNSDHCCVTSPTGSGKTAMVVALLRWARQTGRKAILYTNRVMLVEQTMKTLEKHGIDFGMISSQHRDKRATLRDTQLAMIQTVHARKKRGQEIFKADLVIVDEAHLAGNGCNEQILRAHAATGGTLCGVTATPLGVSHLYPHLIVAGRVSDCRKCGALVPAIVYAPDELDCSKIKLTKTGEYNYEDIKKFVWTPAIVGRVYDQWRHLNPEGKPAVCFAPGVAESQWFVGEFARRGVPCAHIDGEDVYVDGEAFPSSREKREEVVQRWRDGEIKIIFNRFVLREGVDYPWMFQLILATPIGSLGSYIQTVGRVLRRSAETPDHVIVTDHGGNYYRHPSPNSDIDWEKWYFEDPTIATRVHLDALRDKREEAAITCPRCGLVRKSGKVCLPPLGCGYRMERRTRMVLQHDGTLRPVKGEPVKARFVREMPDTFDLWKKIYFRCKKADMSLAQAEGLFVHENGYWPPRDLPLMPRDGDEITWFRKIAKVPVTDLRSDAEHLALRQEKGEAPCLGSQPKSQQKDVFA